MLVRPAAATFNIVCSDELRNGKTLVARLLADYLILCGREPAIFDLASGPGGIRRFFPFRARKIDLSSTLHQMALFDRALTQPDQDYVVDLPAHLRLEFFELMTTLGFCELSTARNVNTAIFFLIDRTIASLLAARQLRDDYRLARFIVVKNEAIVPSLSDFWRWIFLGISQATAS